MSQELCVKSDKVYVKRDGLKVTHRDFSRVKFLPNILKETESCKTSGFQSLHIIMLTYQFILRNVKKEISMPPNRKFTSFLHQKAVYSPLDFSLTLKFCLYPYPPNYKCKGLPFHQILNEW